MESIAVNNSLSGQYENDFKETLKRWKEEIKEAAAIVFDWAESGFDGIQEIHSSADLIDGISKLYGIDIDIETYSKVMNGLKSASIVWNSYKHMRNIVGTVTDSGDYVMDRALSNPPSEFEEAFDNLSDFIQFGVEGPAVFALDKGLEMASYLIDIIWEYLPSSKKKIRKVFGYDNDVVDIVYDVGKKRNIRATRDQDITREDYDGYNKKIREWKPAIKNVRSGRTEDVLQDIIFEKNNTEALIQEAKKDIETYQAFFDEISRELNSRPKSKYIEILGNAEISGDSFEPNAADSLWYIYKIFSGQTETEMHDDMTELEEKGYLTRQSDLMENIDKKQKLVDQSEAWLKKVNEYLAFYEYLKKADEEKKSQYRQGAPYKTLPKSLQSWRGAYKPTPMASKEEAYNTKSIVDSINAEKDRLSASELRRVLDTKNLPSYWLEDALKRFKLTGSESSTINNWAIGTTNAGDLFLAGEDGPELVAGAGGSRVFTAGATKDIIGRAYRDAFDLEQVGFTDSSAFHLPQQEFFLDPGTAIGKDSRGPQVENNANSNKTYTISIEGKGKVQIDGAVLREQMLDTLIENIKPVLIDMLEEEMFVEGNGSYMF